MYNFLIILIYKINSANGFCIDYDKNFKYADCSDAEFYWYRGMDYFVKEYIRKDIDPDKLRSLVNGGQAFVHFFEKARKEVGNVE